MNWLLILGVLLCIISIILLVIFMIKSRELKNIDEEKRAGFTNRLIALNMSALMIGTFGLIVVIFAIIILE